MWNTIVCDGNAAERDLLMESARHCFEGKNIKAHITGCADWQELESIVTHAFPDIVIIAQDGVDGLNTITSARLLSRKIIWFSDLDFGFRHTACASHSFAESRFRNKRWSRHCPGSWS